VYRSQARALLGLPPGYRSADVETAFRRRAAVVHPDRGGDPEEFKALVEGRRILLADWPRRPGPVVVVDDLHPVARWLLRLLRPRPGKPPRVI
ncbi:MAG: hypothetical protein ACRDZY_15885, partial [Acidimicrobiales bacterium]